jgi:hypothetical protein
VVESIVTLGSYELRAAGVTYDHEGRSGCIGGIWHVGAVCLSEESEGDRQPLGA